MALMPRCSCQRSEVLLLVILLPPLLSVDGFLTADLMRYCYCMVIFLLLLMSADGVFDCRYDAPE